MSPFRAGEGETPVKAARAAYAGLSLAALPLLGLFYARYVPLVGAYQAALGPVLAAVFAATLIRPFRGTLLFIFAFPLVNSLPYFFGLAEPLPMAPAALVLGLAFLFAYVLRAAVVPPALPVPSPVSRPLALFAALVAASGLIVFGRYAGFFPFVADGVYEWTVNAHGVSAGGGIMSVVFTALSFLTGIGLFAVLRSTLGSRDRARKAILALAAGSGLSLVFGVVQKLADPRLGNNPTSIAGGLINGTFKDALSFGAFLSMAAPVFLGAAMWMKKAERVLFGGLYIGAAVVILFTGSKSGLLAFMVSSVFTVVALVVFGQTGVPGAKGRARRWLAWAALGAILGAAMLLGINRQGGLWKSLENTASLGRLLIHARNFSWQSLLINRGDILWPVAIAMIRDYPLTGVGVGGYIIEMSNYAADRGLKYGTPESAENLPLQIGSELGLAGLLVAAWILWEIGRRIAGQWKAPGSEPRDRFLLIGLTGGLFAFALNGLVHTFIWSYEIHYTFWLLAALVFALRDDRRAAAGQAEPARAVRKSPAVRILFPAAILLFSAVHLWNSTHSLSLESRAEKYGFKQDFGFYRQEKAPDGRDFRWAGKRAGTELLVEKARFEVPLMASHPDLAKRPVKVEVFLVRRFFKEKRLLRELTIAASDWRTYEFTLSPADVGRSAVILFKVDRTWVPQKALHAPDPRRLGIAVGPIRFLQPRP